MEFPLEELRNIARGKRRVNGVKGARENFCLLKGDPLIWVLGMRLRFHERQFEKNAPQMINEFLPSSWAKIGLCRKLFETKDPVTNEFALIL